MKMTEKTKKYLAVGSGAIICVALIAAIALQFGNLLPEKIRQWGKVPQLQKL